MTEQDPWRKRGESFRRMSLALAIPSYVIAIPFIGMLFGWIGSFWDKRALGVLVGVVVGVVIAIRESRRILKVLTKD